MASTAENSVKNSTYHYELWKHSQGHLKSPVSKRELPTEVSYLKQQIRKTKQTNSDFENGFDHRQNNSSAGSGGDADSMLKCSVNETDHLDEYCRTHSNSFPVKHSQKNFNQTSCGLTANTRTSSDKCNTFAFPNCSGDHIHLRANDLSGRVFGNISQDSAQSQKSPNTVVSRKSSHDLKKLIKSQCKLNKEIGETLKGICNTEARNFHIHDACDAQNNPLNLLFGMSQCNKCSNRLYSQKDVITEKGDIFYCRNTSTLTISLDDVINSRVIIPMVQKLHRMYLNNLKEEMSLIEDLERLPSKVNEIYKSIILKQKD